MISHNDILSDMPITRKIKGTSQVKIIALVIISFLLGFLLHETIDLHQSTSLHQQPTPTGRVNKQVKIEKNENLSTTFQSKQEVTARSGIVTHPVKIEKSSNLSTTVQPKKNSTARPGIVTHPPYDGPLQRQFEKYPGELPCLPGGDKGDYPHIANKGKYMFSYPDKKGMYYAKLSKCSSSTLAGIAVQIARNTAARRRAAGTLKPDFPDEACLVRADHGGYHHVVHRDKSQSMLWTFVREPAKREVSDFFHFHVSRKGVSPTDEILKKEALESLSMVDYMTGMRTRKMDNSTVKVDFILNAYDFIGLVERYHESLVLLKMLYNLELRDILYTSAKRSGGYDDGEYRETCAFIQKSVVSPEMKSWFQTSPDWSKHMEADILLYRVVQKSLDMTIDAFGREEVERQVVVLEEALRLAEEVCGSTAIYPCSSDGKKRAASETSCLDHDWACAYRCIEKLDLSRFQ